MDVYFAKNLNNGNVKIGTSRNAERRIKNIGYNIGAKLVLLRKIKGGYSEEAFTHMFFEDFNIHGEWFSFDEAMMTFELPEDWMSILAERKDKAKMTLTVTDEQKSIIEKAAAAEGMKTATWIKMVVLKQARTILSKAMEVKQ